MEMCACLNVLEQKTWISVIYSKKNIEHSKYRSKARDQVNKRPIKIVHAKTSVTDWLLQIMRGQQKS
jgi:hypothetical protein